MKKTLGIFTFILLLTVSVTAGTLAIYTTNLDDLAEASVVAKEFVLTKGGTDTFTKNVKIAPGEKIEWQFSVKNFEGSIVSETAMDLDFNVGVVAVDGKDVINPLVITIKNSDGDIVGTAASNGTILFDDEFALTADGQEKIYTVSVNWTSNDEVDINYAGKDYGTAVNVFVTGVQK
ncbi:MAG: hypothetical protein CVV02_00050 [Firmicutes bacterium HGW-Firmicutes-7]|nr:MAG: hypothetical protein CVV02_00050 [Firmicutes bacterium HGW-Firmicutes-7]